MGKKYLIFIIMILLCTGCTPAPEKRASDGAVKMRIGIYNGESSLLFFIAEREGYFKENGIDATLTPYPTGRDAAKAMLEGDEDFSVCTEFVALKNSFTRTDYKILAAIAIADINVSSAKISSGVFAKKSSGIFKPEDLKGKKLGVTMNTVTEFLCSVFLEQNDITFNDVTMVNMDPKDRASLLETDAFDAFFVWEPKWFLLLKQYEDQISYFPMPFALPFHFLLLESDQYAAASPKAAEGVLKALIEAEEWAKNNPKKTKTIVMDAFSLSDENAVNSLKRHQFTVTFPYTLPRAMESQLDWLEEYKSAEKSKIENIEDLFNIEPLNKVKPTAITIIK